MNTTVISIKIDKQTKIEAQKLAEKLGFSLSGVIKAQLKHFIRSKRVDVAVRERSEKKPTKFFIESLKQSDEDIKAGRVTSFKNMDEAIAYLDREIEDERRKQANR